MITTGCIKLHDCLSVHVFPPPQSSVISQPVIGVTQLLFAMGNRHLGKIGRYGEALKCTTVVSHTESQDHYFTSRNGISTYFHFPVCNENLFLFLIGECLHPRYEKTNTQSSLERVWNHKSNPHKTFILKATPNHKQDVSNRSPDAFFQGVLSLT